MNCIISLRNNCYGNFFFIYMKIKVYFLSLCMQIDDFIIIYREFDLLFFDNQKYLGQICLILFIDVGSWVNFWDVVCRF